jgi:hypothetical protein
MPGLRRAKPIGLVLDLTKQLAEDYDSIPLPEVTRIVGDAVATTTGPDGRLDANAEGLPAVIAVIEHLAREDLDQLSAQRAETGSVTPARAAGAPQAADPSGRRQGAE